MIYSRKYKNKTRREWADELGLLYSTFSKRVQEKGWEEAVSYGSLGSGKGVQPNEYMHGRITRTLNQWADFFGVKYAALNYYKITYGEDNFLDIMFAKMGVVTTKKHKKKHKIPRATNYCCRVGSRVLHKSKEVEVVAVLEEGSDKKKTKAYVNCCVVDGGISMRNRRVHAGYDWEPLKYLVANKMEVT